MTALQTRLLEAQDVVRTLSVDADRSISQLQQQVQQRDTLITTMQVCIKT